MKDPGLKDRSGSHQLQLASVVFATQQLFASGKPSPTLAHTRGTNPLSTQDMGFE